MSGESVSITIAAAATATADAADPQRPLERHRAAEAEAKAELDEGRGLLLAAVEGMGEAARHAAPAQLREHRVDGAPDVQQHRQAELGGEAELRREDRRLALVIEAGDEVVEADLADRDQARVAGVARERVAQRRQVVVAGRVGAHRMDAERVGEPMPVRELAHPLEVGDGYRRDDDLGDAGGARPRDDVVAIGVELGGVEVAMRVDPHAAMMPARAAAGAVTGHAPACYRIDEGLRGDRRATCSSSPARPVAARMPPMKRVPLYSRSHRPTETPAEPAAAAGDRRGAAAPRRSRGRWAALARHERRLWALLIVCLGVAFWWSNPTFRAKPPLTIEQIDAAIRQSIEDKPLVSPESRAYDAIIPSVVRVVGLMTEGDDGSDKKENGTVERGVGTGVVIIDNGTILTNLHVVSGAKKIRVTFFDGSESDAMVLSTQPENDLAVLRAKTDPRRPRGGDDALDRRPRARRPGRSRSAFRSASARRRRPASSRA